MEGRNSGTVSDLVVLCMCMLVVYSTERSQRNQKAYDMKQLFFRFCRWKK